MASKENYVEEIKYTHCKIRKHFLCDHEIDIIHDLDHERFEETDREEETLRFG